MENKKSLKKQLLGYFIAAGILPVLVVGIYFFFFMQNSMQQRTVDISESILRGSLDKIVLRINQANELANAICTEDGLQALLQMTKEEAGAYTQTKHLFLESLLRQFESRPVTEQILSLFIIGENGIDLRNGTEASLADAEALRQLAEQASLSQEGTRWMGIMPNITRLSEYSEVIAYCRPIYHEQEHRVLGHLLILYDAAFFANECTALIDHADANFLLIQPDGAVMAVGSGAVCAEEVVKLVLAEGEQAASTQVPSLIVREKSAQTGWTLAHIIPMAYFRRESRALLQIVLIVIAVMLFTMLFFSYFLSNNFTRPISAMIASVRRIASGDFSEQIYQDETELGQLGKNIDSMRGDIARLMREGIAQEEEKRKMELRMMQQQINPHFLNNSLNSIRMMAKMQGTYGIMKMIDALAGMLKANLDTKSEYWTVEKELELAEQYLYIQNIRFMGNIRFIKQAAPDTRSLLVPRFLLQPLLENAVLHGLQTQADGGDIYLEILRQDNFLHIRIDDNGGGIAPDTLQMLQEKLLSDSAQTGQEGRGIGLHNVHARIRMLYGEPFGITIESRLHSFTRVSILLPLHEEVEDNA